MGEPVDTQVPGFTMAMPPDPGLQDSMVHSLFQVQSKAWDVDVVTDLSDHDMVVHILSLPLSPIAVHDNWYWIFEPRGAYSIKSAYRQLH